MNETTIVDKCVSCIYVGIGVIFRYFKSMLKVVFRDDYGKSLNHTYGLTRIFSNHDQPIWLGKYLGTPEKKYSEN